MRDTVTIGVEEIEGISYREIEVPTDISLSLMEVLKGEGYPIQAACDGMALCATCHVEIKSGHDALPEAGTAELDMLDQLPMLYPTSRLSCQIRIGDITEDIQLRVVGK